MKEHPTVVFEFQGRHLIDVLLARAERTPGVVAYEMVDGADALPQRWRADAVTEVVVWNRIRALCR
jgi:hypothetical protein